MDGWIDSMNEKLDLSALEKAIAQLESSLFYYHLDVVQKDPNFVMQLRAAAIQAFEFTYELSCKMIKRYLNLVEASPTGDREISFPNLIRTACEYGLLLNDLETWMGYRKERGTTSHTYDEEKAIEIFTEIPAFLEEVKYLLKKLKENN
jgi:nucleotidyltransferase substrate binding protein (TIGR01987 family)